MSEVSVNEHALTKITDTEVRSDSYPAIFALAFVMFILFSLTGHYGTPYGTDPLTNAAQARAFADDQDPILEELEGFGNPRFQGDIAWFTESVGGTTSKYPPGVAVWAAPFYLFDFSTEEVQLSSGDDQIEITVPATYVPATIAASLSVAVAMGFLGLTLAPLMDRTAVLGTMIVGGFGTTAWSVAADRLWQHGPAMMCISIGTFFASRDRFLLSGAAFSAAILVRPHTAVIAAAIGIAVAVSRRSVRELAMIGSASVVGLVALVAYNNAVYGDYSVTGGYAAGFTERATSTSVFVVAERLVLSLIHERVGILKTSPFIAISLYAVVRFIRSSPAWGVGATIGGFVYLLVQFRANRVTGGSGFFSYRYPLEALMAAGPMLAYSTKRWMQESVQKRKVFGLAAAASIFIHAVGSIF